MRAGLFTFLCLVSTACGSGADFSSPEGAAAAYLEAVSDDDREALVEAVVHGESVAMEKAAERAEERGIEYEEPESNLEDFTILDSDIRGNRAVVRVRTVRELGDRDVEREETVICVRERGDWKVSMDATVNANRNSPATGD